MDSAVPPGLGARHAQLVRDAVHAQHVGAVGRPLGANPQGGFAATRGLPQQGEQRPVARLLAAQVLRPAPHVMGVRSTEEVGLRLTIFDNNV